MVKGLPPVQLVFLKCRGIVFRCSEKKTLQFGSIRFLTKGRFSIGSARFGFHSYNKASYPGRTFLFVPTKQALTYSLQFSKASLLQCEVPFFSTK